MSDQENDFAANLLHGADEIAEFLFGDRKHRRKIYHLIETSNFPHFKMGSMICARRSVLLRWVDEQERRHSGQPTNQTPLRAPEPQP